MTTNFQDRQSYFDQLTEVFSAYLSDPYEFRTSLERAHLAMLITDQHWDFTISQLHQQCSAWKAGLAELSYKEFRQLLYNNPTHETVKNLGGVFEIQRNLRHVDKNIFRLRKLTK